MSRERAEETCTIRLPAGMANEIRAASGQPLSRLARVMFTQYLALKKAEGAQALQQLQQDAASVASATKEA